MQNVTAVTSAKGGVGKTTITAALGAMLADRGKKILLIDGNSGFRNLDIVLGVSKKLVFDMADIIRGSCNIDKAILCCERFNNLFLLPAVQNNENRLSSSVMKHLVFLLSKCFDHVIIDCPVENDFSADVIFASKVLIVVTADPVCLRVSSLISEKLESKFDVEKRLVVNRFSKKCFLKSNVISDFDEIIDFIGVQLLAIIPEDDRVKIDCGKGLVCPKTGPAANAFHEMSVRFAQMF
ncbi:MAG: AAA family ATPase [Oscillospiraceae bacterium]|nr:AAA family ATPase [Oscillospiraceae bacterium]